jgi:hypothetical protein
MEWVGFNEPKTPEEKILLERINKYTNNFWSCVVFGQQAYRKGKPITYRANEQLSERELKIVVSAIQWLGTKQGKLFLNEDI